MSQAKFTWIQAYSEIAKAINNLNRGEAELIDIFLRVFNEEANGLKFSYKDGEPGKESGIDPFTFFAAFNRGLSKVNRIKAIRLVMEELGIGASLPSDFEGVPTVYNKKSWFFAGKGERGASDINNLWLLFKSAAEFAIESNQSHRSAFVAAFDVVRAQKCVTWNITIGLFWMFPDQFLSLDNNSRDYLATKYGIKVPGGLHTGEEYLSLTDAVRAATSKPFYEISADAYHWKPATEEALKSGDLSNASSHAEQNTDEDSSIPSAPKQYWWLTANRKIWSFSEITAGEEQSYTIYNEKGNPRRIYKNFLDARAGDVVVGYEAAPVKKVVALCEVSRPQDGERLYFKKIRDLDAPIALSDIKADPVLSQCEFCKNPNGSFFKLTEDEYLRLEEMFDEDDVSPVQASAKSSYDDDEFLHDVFVSEADLTSMKGLLERKKNLILQGAPGTGKTFAAKRLAYAMMGEEDDSRIGLVQFHQSYTYEDFVIGYRPNGEGGFDVQPGIFADFCSRAARDSGRKYFFIIDEINRANISKVFGELLMPIEADHRGDSIELPIDRRRLAVPDNLYIIGMMNTADRGLALIDYALRRRFAFFDMKPALDAPGFQAMLQKTNNKKLSALVDKVREINKEIEKDPALGKGFCIGHSYFCVSESITDADVHGIARFEIEPLIAEYWFDDQQRVRTLTDKLEGVFNA
ncbi:MULTISPECIES: AAA family ATPase [Enorma]|uniref:AAA family ATPase n=1 Tax=Enorma TaxID=1472762 RepID=UPI000379DDBD|nr:MULTISPECIES: AAA family ATPase [Enorma]